MSLKSQTQHLHSKAEMHPFNQNLMNGTLSQSNYLRWLYCQKNVFEAIENRVKLPHKSLQRAPKAALDISSRTGEDFSVDASDRYVNHINEIDSDHILPHVYLNYLALLFGGSMIRAKVSGTTHIFKFENTKECIASVREIEKDTGKWVDEVNLGFLLWIDIFDTLYHTMS